MYRSGILIAAARWLRRYLVALALIGTLAAAMIQVYTTGVGPRPQQPPEGYVVERDRASLQWDKGTIERPIELQVSIDDPEFGNPAVERKTSGTSHSLRDLEPGSTYYWRLVQDGEPSRTASFSVSKYNVHI